MTERPDAEKLLKLSKQNVRRYAEMLAAATTSHGTELDPGALADRIWDSTRRCLLCRKPTYVFGLYTPGKGADPVTNTGLGKSQARVFYYGLCVGCYRTEDASVRVEETIADRMLGEANMRAALDAAGVGHTNEALPDGSRFVAVEEG
jgi:hypothetical protein